MTSSPHVKKQAALRVPIQIESLFQGMIDGGLIILPTGYSGPQGTGRLVRDWVEHIIAMIEESGEDAELSERDDGSAEWEGEAEHPEFSTTHRVTVYFPGWATYSVVKEVSWVTYVREVAHYSGVKVPRMVEVAKKLGASRDWLKFLSMIQSQLTETARKEGLVTYLEEKGDSAGSEAMKSNHTVSVSDTEDVEDVSGSVGWSAGLSWDASTSSIEVTMDVTGRGLEWEVTFEYNFEDSDDFAVELSGGSTTEDYDEDDGGREDHIYDSWRDSRLARSKLSGILKEEGLVHRKRASIRPTPQIESLFQGMIDGGLIKAGSGDTAYTIAVDWVDHIVTMIEESGEGDEGGMKITIGDQDTEVEGERENSDHGVTQSFTLYYPRTARAEAQGEVDWTSFVKRAAAETGLRVQVREVAKTLSTSRDWLGYLQRMSSKIGTEIRALSSFELDQRVGKLAFEDFQVILDDGDEISGAEAKYELDELDVEDYETHVSFEVSPRGMRWSITYSYILSEPDPDYVEITGGRETDAYGDQKLHQRRREMTPWQKGEEERQERWERSLSYSQRRAKLLSGILKEEGLVPRGKEEKQANMTRDPFYLLYLAFKKALMRDRKLRAEIEDALDWELNALMKDMKYYGEVIPENIMKVRNWNSGFLPVSHPLQWLQANARQVLSPKTLDVLQKMKDAGMGRDDGEILEEIDERFEGISSNFDHIFEGWLGDMAQRKWEELLKNDVRRR